MTCLEATSAKEVMDEEGNVFKKILVKEHKTVPTYGSAMLFLYEGDIQVVFKGQG